MNYFELLDLPRSLQLEEAEILRRYFAKSREYHPDFHGTDDPAAQQSALETSSQVNNAYATLRDPFERARYLVGLELPDLSDADKKKIPPSLLMEVMEMQETVSSLHDEPDESARQPLKATLTGIEERLRETTSGLRGELDALSRQWDSLGDDAGSDQKRPILMQINTLLNTRNYLRTLLAAIGTELRGEEAIRH